MNFTIRCFNRTSTISRGVTVLVGAVLAMVLVAGASAAVTTVVHPSTTAWTQDDTRSGGAVEWSDAFGAPTGFGLGSLELTTDATNGAKAGLYNHSMSGTALSAVSTLSYSTYQQAASFAGGDASFQLQIDVDGTLGDGSGFTTLVYEPYNGSPANGVVAPQVWQTWDVSAGEFWSSRNTASAGGGGLTAGAGGPPFYTLDEVKAMYPAAVVVGVGVNVGTFNPGYDIGVDAIQVNDTTYDFETEIPGCATATSETTITLLADCTETSPFTVPAGFTFDGAGHTLTAADPSSSAAFVGAAVQNTAGGSMDVENLHVLGASSVLDCSPFTGVQFVDGGGSVTNTTVDNLLRGGYTGCQNGLGVVVNDVGAASSSNVTIDRVAVTRYNKNGMTVRGNVVATVTNNTVTGAGPLGSGFAAQNGIQISFGASALVSGNSVSGNDYTPSSDVACGLLLFEANGVKQQSNDLFSNERNLCNAGRGGGNVSPN
jgi:hypothetical protein